MLLNGNGLFKWNSQHITSNSGFHQIVVGYVGNIGRVLSQHWRQPADQVLKGVVDVPLLLGLRGDHQRLPRPSGVRVRQRGLGGRTRGTGRDLDVSILLSCLHSALCLR